jgi:nucleotide-binding universal stress UspA family protein
MFNKILVPLDGSKLAERALAPAFTLGQHTESEMIVARVLVAEKILVPDMYLYGGYGVQWPDQALEEARAEATEYLQNIHEARGKSRLVITTKVLEGDVAGAIVALAVKDKVDLIVMSSHGYSGLPRWMLGSVAERVLSIAPCPVLIIRSTATLSSILVALDGSELSERALAPALEVARGFNSQVTLLRAVPEVTPRDAQTLDEIERGLGMRLQEEIHEDAAAYLNRLAAAARDTGLDVSTIVLHDSAATGILNHIDNHPVDMIAMSTHGRSGLQHWIYGSITEKVLRNTTRSMLVVRPGTPPAQD